MKKYLLAIIIVVILSAGVIVGLVLIKNNQLFKQKAFNSSGTATITINPPTGNIDLNTSSTVSVLVNTGGLSVKTLQFVIDYSNIGIKASNVVADSNFIQAGWTCPIKTVSTSTGGSTDQVEVSCYFTTAGTGYSNNTDTTIATFDVTPTQIPPVNPVIFSFDPDPNLTEISLASDASDIALTPSSTGVFTINGQFAQSPTPTPTIIVSTPTPTPSLIAAATDTPVPTDTATAAPTATATATAAATSSSATTSPTSTGSPSLPVTGFDAPTIVGGGIGVTLLMFAAAALIL